MIIINAFLKRIQLVLIFALSLSIHQLRRRKSNDGHGGLDSISNLAKDDPLDDEETAICIQKTIGFPDERPCTQGLLDHVELEDCKASRIIDEVRDVLETIECPWDLNYEVQLTTRTFSYDKAKMYLDDLCKQAELNVLTTSTKISWTEIDGKMNADFLQEFFDGGTDLNTQTGNLQNDDGTDPRKNEFYPTDDFSFGMARSVRDFMELHATSFMLSEVEHLDTTCDLQTMMCCYKRDRQSNDGNGDCDRKDCVNAAPGDNTNLCYHDDTRYPGDETIHCHGFAWGNETDPEYHLRYSSMFYILFYDHWYTRGYVESVLDSAPMCSCIENMPTVVRADCSEARMLTKYYISNDGTFRLDASDLDFEFKSCRGINDQRNDLASKVSQMALDGHIGNAKRDLVFEKLVGHFSPERNVNEEACDAAWQNAQAKTNEITNQEANGTSAGSFVFSCGVSVIACLAACLTSLM